MQLRYWLVPGKKQQNKLVERKAFADTVRIKSADFNNIFFLEFCGFPCFLINETSFNGSDDQISVMIYISKTNFGASGTLNCHNTGR